MCIAIMNKNGVTLKKSVLRNCWENNGDGAGILWADNGKMKVYKEMVSFHSFYAKYSEVRAKNKGNIVLHFRIATHGGINEVNCHPFLVNNKLGFVHNGIIRTIVGYDKEKSDTNLFCDFLKTLPNGWQENTAMYDLIGSAIGTANKLVFLNSDGQYAIVNENEGVWDMGCWFSNTTYKDYGYKDFGGTKIYNYKKSSYKYNDYGWQYSSGVKTKAASKPYETKWWDKPLEEDYEMTQEQKRDYGYLSESCDCCLKSKDSHYDTNTMAYLCVDCQTEWSTI